MKKTIFEEMGGTYIRHGDYFIPCLTLPEEEQLEKLHRYQQEGRQQPKRSVKKKSMDRER